MNFEARSKLIPIAESVAALLTPNVSRSQLGVAAATQALMTESDPNALVVAHANPAAPLFPSVSDSAVVDPIRVQSADMLRRPFPKLRDDAGIDSVMVDALARGMPRRDVVAGKSNGRLTAFIYASARHVAPQA
jgi:hypothetical protein